MKHFKRGWISKTKEGEWKVVIEEVVRDDYGAESKEDALRILASEKGAEGPLGEFFAYDRFPIKDDYAEILDLRYRVFYSGSRPDIWEEYETREEAEQYAIEQAKEIAEGNGIEPEEVTIYGGPMEPEGWGACPRDCLEAGYPEISIMLK